MRLQHRIGNAPNEFEAIAHGDEEDPVVFSISELFEANDIFELLVDGVGCQRFEFGDIEARCSFQQPRLFVESAKPRQQSQRLWRSMQRLTRTDPWCIRRVNGDCEYQELQRSESLFC